MTWNNPQTQQVRWLDALNTSDEEIPAHAVVWVNSAGLASEYGAELPQDPYVLEVFRFPAIDSTVDYSIEVAGDYGPTCVIQEQYHDVMGYFAINGPTPIPAGGTGAVTCDPPFVALSDATGLPLVPLAGQWHLTRPQDSDPGCADPYIWFEWYRCLRDMRPGEMGVRPMFVDIDSVHYDGTLNDAGGFP